MGGLCLEFVAQRGRTDFVAISRRIECLLGGFLGRFGRLQRGMGGKHLVIGLDGGEQHRLQRGGMGPVGGFQRLPGRFDPCRPTTEIEQQVVEAQGRRHPGVFGTKITTARDRHAIADTAARRILAARDRHREIEGGQIGRFGHADLRRLLAGRRPRLTGFRVMTERLFDDIDQAPFVRLVVQNLTGIVPGLSRGPAGRL